MVPVAGEAREETAEQAALGFQILAAACNPPMDPAELYRQIGLHMTDSVAHNKFLHEDVPKLFDLDFTVGQIFCATYSGRFLPVLSFDRTLLRLRIMSGVRSVMSQNEVRLNLIYI